MMRRATCEGANYPTNSAGRAWRGSLKIEPRQVSTLRDGRHQRWQDQAIHHHISSPLHSYMVDQQGNPSKRKSRVRVFHGQAVKPSHPLRQWQTPPSCPLASNRPSLPQADI